jgi:2'-5' RNA ligase
MRLFMGVAIPEATRNALAALTGRLVSAVPGLTAVKPEAMHVTLRFLGEVAPSDAGELRRRMQSCRLATRGFLALLAGYGQFPPNGQPRVLYVGFRSGVEPFVALWRELCALTGGIGTEETELTFVPHVTLLRNKRLAIPRGSPELAELARGLDDLAAEVGVSSAGLYESLLHAGGPRYTLLEEVRCAP